MERGETATALAEEIRSLRVAVESLAAPIGAASFETVARLLDVSASTVRRMVRAGRLEVITVGARPRIPLSALRALTSAARSEVTGARRPETRRSRGSRSVSLPYSPEAEVERLRSLRASRSRSTRRRR